MKFGRPPTDNRFKQPPNFANGYDGSPFTIGYPEIFGGGPVRQHGNLIKCNCLNIWTFDVSCPPPGYTGNEGDCAPMLEQAPTSASMPEPPPLANAQFYPVVFENPTLQDNDQSHLYSPWIVSNLCDVCEQDGNGPGSRWPDDAISKNPDGTQMALAGWDSRVPLTWVLEHPEYCNLVSEEDVIAIGQWNVASESRYADSCDYMMTCMYEENSIKYMGKPYWFQSSTDDVLFYISGTPIKTSDISDGFCFPDVGARSDEEKAALADECKATRDFRVLNTMFRRESFLAVRVDVATFEYQRANVEEWFPHRMQLSLRYWQRRSFFGVLTKELVEGKLYMSDFQPTTGTARGFEYDLRITFVPIAWLEVLNNFALSVETYLIFYVALDTILCLIVISIWGVFRVGTRQTNPPRLNFAAWLKGFELNPVKGFTIVVFPVLTMAFVGKYVMVDYDPFSFLAGDFAYIGSGALKVTEEVTTRWIRGRTGIMILVLGFQLMQIGASLLCPRRDMPGSIWRPGYWQRRHVLYTSIWLFIILLLALEFSFSSFFKMQPIACMLGFKVVWVYMEVWLLKTLTEKLVALPFECSLQTIQYVMTLGANNFLNFMNANVVELGVMIFMRAVRTQSQVSNSLP